MDAKPAERTCPAARLSKRTVEGLTYTGSGNGACYVWDAELKGFGVRVFPSGRKAFLVTYRAGGTKRFLTLGTFGKDMTADQARKEAKARLGEVVRGADPAAEKREQRARAATLGTLAELLESYRATLDNPATAADARQSFAKNIPRRLAAKKAADVTGDELADALQAVGARGALAVQRNLWRFLHAAFEHGLAHREAKRRFRLTGNPVSEVEKPDPAPPGDRELSGDEIRALWLRLDLASMAPETATAFRLLLLLGQRVEEILGARWQEIDFERRVLDIPPERLKTGAKTRRGHVVPLPEMALSLLRELPERGPFVFPGRPNPKDPDQELRPVQFRSLSQAADRLCNDPDNPFPRFTPRDIRRSIKTRLSEIGVLKEIRDRVQNHALHDVASKHYDRFDYLADKRAALEGWEWELRRILAGRPPSEDWKRWLRRFVREPDNEFPGRQLARLLDSGPAAEVAELPKAKARG